MRDGDLLDGLVRVEPRGVDREGLGVEALADGGVGEVAGEFGEVLFRCEVGAHDVREAGLAQVAGEGEGGVEDVFDAAAAGGVDGGFVGLVVSLV